MLRIIFIIFCLLMLFGGCNDAYNGWKHPTPTRMTVAEFAASDQSAEWLELIDAKLNVLKAAVVTDGKGGKIKKLYVPIESEDFFQEKEISLLLDTDDEKLLQIATELYQMSEGEQLKYIVKNREAFLREMELTGTMSSKESLNGSRVKELRATVTNLADKFHIMKHGADVNFIRGLIIAAVASFFLIFALLRRKKKIQTQQAIEEASD